MWCAPRTSWNRSIIFTGDRNCFPRLKDVCTEPPISDLEKWNHPRAFLNSGAFIGRVSLLKSLLFPDPVPAPWPFEASCDPCRL